MRDTPKGGAGFAGAASSDGKPVSIGTVLTLLREEFPEVTISKIRFLEAEGLVEPKRTPSGYRKFTAADVERLAAVLRMQRDHYLPLKVIREHLDALERGERVQLPAPATPSRDLVEGVHEPGEERPTAARIGRAELLAAAEVDEAALADWESYGLIVPHAEGGYDIEAVTVAKLVADLGRFGLEPRHLRAVKAAAEREAGLVEQVVAPLRRHRNPQTRAHAEATARELATLSVRLHAALVQSALRVRL
ncbi:DNA-binding transcriptional regulator, MerR family [Streptomyces sp. 2224.1]|uniref:transcriptional regulator FtsR n=1 Tax=Streptomyces TaxID=1883 RepID=UPI00089571F8|nr:MULTISPECIES: MerR family transcriptional regulator [Streptomyces]MCZ1011202.1 MerR family transcriptional regulator [Streptomyces lydicus]SED31265.1 DNA-binding transcriptional regulator, MerR family [Streptomyces sp. 2224.1]SEF11610.1 DNA-binding transcriptional regulator, MerR family [Streptomyces sp. 2112.3]